MSHRPRRSTRQTFKAAASAPTNSPSKPKRVSQVIDPDEVLKQLLNSPKSILTRIDISDVFNFEAWEMLSKESRVALSRFLPPTAFVRFTPSSDLLQPSSKDMMDIDRDVETSNIIDPTIFNDPHFIASSHTFQDHLHCGWLSHTHCQKVENFQRAIESGQLSAPWKDDAWLLANAAPEPVPLSTTNSTGDFSCLPGIAGGAAQIRLTTLVKERIIQIGDILAYRRNLTNLDISVEKDVIIRNIDENTYSLTVLTEAGSAKDLPECLLHSPPSDTPQDLRQLTDVTSPTMLETRLLDIDGRVTKAQRPNGNAWKAMTVWRRREEVGALAEDKRGGRENYGTLFYLRSVYYNETGH